MKKFISKHAFWVVQLLSCAAFSVIIYFAFNPVASSLEKFLFLLGMFLSFFIPTTILRYLYKAFVHTSPFKALDFLKIFLFLIIIIILGRELPYYLGWSLGRISSWFGLEKGEFTASVSVPAAKGIFAYVGSFVLYGGWTFLYFIIKEYRKYMASRLARLELKDKIKQAQLNTLKGHLNPRFMISSLQMIKQQMKVDIPMSRDLLTKLSEILRYSLTKNNVNSVPLHEELEIVKNYIALLPIYEKDKYKIYFDLDCDTLIQDVPPMLLSSLMEIATKHGILQQTNGGEVVFTSREIKEVLEIRMVHNGKIARSNESELIEKTIKQRLRLLFEGKAEFSTEHELNKTTLLVKIPMNKS